MRPTRSPYRQNTPCAQWFPSTCTLTEYDSCVTFHKLYTQPFHTFNIPTPKSEYHRGTVAKGESVSRCLTYPRQKANTTEEQLRKGNLCHAALVSLRKKVSSKNKNAGKKHRLSRLKSTFLFVHDPIVLFCSRNSSLIIR